MLSEKESLFAQTHLYVYLKLKQKKSHVNLIAPEAEITDINFDPSLGEIIIETKKPGLVIGRNGAVLQEIIKKTKWRPHVLRSPPIKSKIVTHMRHYLHSESKERERILRTVGERIFRPKTYDVGDIRINRFGWRTRSRTLMLPA